MRNIQIDHKDSIFNQRFARDYGSGKLSQLWHYAPELKSIKNAISERHPFSTEQRQTLVEVLRDQYSKSGITPEGQVGKNLDLLGQEGTYTLCTGQQIHIGLGPLYVLYKILNVIQLAKECKESYPDYDFVPVFWMATEDHDLEEIQEIHFYGKAYKWDTDQQGAVGRMNTQGIPEMIDEIRNDLNLSEEQLEFLDRAQEAYRLGDLSSSTRKLVHAYTASQGLLILDADDSRLKAQFVSVIRSELEGQHFGPLTSCTQEMADLGYEPQIHIREINLFWLEDGFRGRLEWKDDTLVAEGRELCKAADIQGFVDKNYAHFSPNVALRPLYQECILPNLLYVGGPSEVKYWMQLGKAFEINGLKMPLIFQRTNNIILPENKVAGMEVADLLFLHKAEEELVQHFSEQGKEMEEAFNQRFRLLQDQLEELRSFFDQSFPGANINGKVGKIIPKLRELEQITAQQLVRLAEQNPEMKKVLKLKRMYFDQNNPQERGKHIPEYAKSLVSLLSNNVSHGFDNSLKINHLVANFI